MNYPCPLTYLTYLLPHKQHSKTISTCGLLIQLPVCIAINGIQAGHWIATAQAELFYVFFIESYDFLTYPLDALYYDVCPEELKKAITFAAALIPEEIDRLKAYYSGAVTMPPSFTAV